MLARPRHALEVLSVSALDLFASALGVFVLMAVIMFPFYLRLPSIEADIGGAQRELSAAGRSMTEAEAGVREAARELAEAEVALAEAQARLQRMESAAEQSEQTLAEAAAQAEAARQELGALGHKMASLAIADLDLVIVMDTTGSMGDELRDIQINLLGMIRVLHRLAPTLNVGFVAFKDRMDEYLTRNFPLTSMTEASLQEILAFVQRLTPGGGGDRPEPVDEALRVALEMPWRDEAQGQIVVIGDAPAHMHVWGTAYDMAARFHRMVPEGALPRRVSTVFTGQRPESEPFFERLALAGGGEFTAHRGQMIESVLLSVLQGHDRVAAREGAR